MAYKKQADIFAIVLNSKTNAYQPKTKLGKLSSTFYYEIRKAIINHLLKLEADHRNWTLNKATIFIIIFLNFTMF